MPVQPTPPPQQPVQIITETPGETNIKNDNETNSNSVSNAENAVVQNGSLSNIQVNNGAHELGYYRYSNNVSMPATTVYANISAVNDRWDWNRTQLVATVGIKHAIGGKSKKLAETSVRRDNMARSLSICNSLGVFKGEAEIDYEMMPDLADCQYVAQRTKVPTNSLKELKADLQKSIKLIDMQQETIKALKLRLTQMQHEPTVVEPTW